MYNVAFEFEINSSTGLLDTYYKSDQGQDSFGNLFQALGMLLRWVDAVAEFDPALMPLATEYFTATVSRFDVAKCVPFHLLTAADWKARMMVAWISIEDEEQRLAIQMDYTQYVNYWPTIDFCEPAWQEEAQKWASDPSAYDPLVEFPIAKAVREAHHFDCDHSWCTGDSDTR